MEIDFVITWVDMNDPKWQQELANASGKVDNSHNGKSEARFRDAGLLKYWFRGVDTFAPWVRKIYFVTCGQKPEWLDVSHPKLHLINHQDYIPKEALPTFNSNVIEMYLHLIPGLSEHFVYFNDDMYLINHVTQGRFFTNGVPNDIAAFRTNLGLSMWSRTLLNNIVLINRRFNKKEILKRDAHKWYHPSYGKKARLTRLLRWYPKFVTLRTPHNAQPYLKRTLEEIWEYAGEELAGMSKNHFRSREDYTQELFRTWQICQSYFEPYNTYRDTKYYPLVLKSKRAIGAIRNQSYMLVCINDNVHIRNYEATMQQIREAFDSILPIKSRFEL